MTTKKLPPIHPGEILKEEFLEPFGMSQQQLAESLNVSRQQISNIIQGKQAITAEMALRLGRYFGLSAKFWLNLQNHYDLDVAEEALSKRLAQEIKPYLAICDPVITRSAIISYQ
ncbi:MAG: HigA family addiction module antitoxin [Candidatus Parabeggiatoa sp.]|nr:HigA family addiction module antitoxin [Candidatus Parabeggiatoa sp.]